LNEELAQGCRFCSNEFRANAGLRSHMTTASALQYLAQGQRKIKMGLCTGQNIATFFFSNEAN
jgi:hypothetical protein